MNQRSSAAQYVGNDGSVVLRVLGERFVPRVPEFQRALRCCAYMSKAKMALSPLLVGPEYGLEMGGYDILKCVEFVVPTPTLGIVTKA